MIQCASGHFFDEQKNSACPYCATPIDMPPPGRTVAIRPPAEGPPAAGGAPAAPLAGKTVRLVEEQLGIQPVVGWLVCIEGPDRGRDYRLRTEKNFIGRDPSMDVSVGSDPTVSRVRHAAVAFEPEEKQFWLIPGEASGLVYLNGQVVHSPGVMKHRDVVRLGKTQLMLVALVGEEFQWD
ncbi:MAG: FHA domain-containing protein [Bryobacteraceae bacterium]